VSPRPVLERNQYKWICYNTIETLSATRFRRRK